MAREEYSDLNDYMGPDVRTDNVDLWVNRTDRLTAMIEAARDNPTTAAGFPVPLQRETLLLRGYMYTFRAKSIQTSPKARRITSPKLGPARTAGFPLRGFYPAITK